LATSFPTGLDVLTNPTSADTLASPDHAAQHANVNDAVEAIEAAIGITSSPVLARLASPTFTGTVTAPTFVGALTGTASDVANSAVIAKVLTGYASGAGTVSATDSLLQAINKLNGNITAMNGYPRGLMAAPASTTTTGTFTAEVEILSYTFSAVSGRTYSIVYYEPTLQGSASATCTARLREGSSVGTVLNSASMTLPTAFFGNHMVQRIYTASATGSFTVSATLQASTGTGTATRSSTTNRFPQLYAIDIGVV